MRLEYNARGMCYRLYCDTREEHEKLKSMLEKPITATDLKSIDNMIYAYTDSLKTMKKLELNSVYGRMVMMNKNYIVAHRNKQPMIIFKSHIFAVERDEDGRAIILSTDVATLYLDENYNDIVKQLI